jgi:hypothetical protein
LIAVDTNILVYAHRVDSEFHTPAEKKLRNLAEGLAGWAIPWPCLYEFFAIVTHPKVFNPPTPWREALQQIQYWLESPRLVLLSESSGFWEELKGREEQAKVVGAMFHDLRVATLCYIYQIECLWSADRDFSRFPFLRVENPLIGG